MFFKKVCKRRGIAEIQLSCDMRNCRFRIREEQSRTVKPFVENILLRRNAKGLFEKIGKIDFIHVEKPGKIFEQDFFAEMLIDITEYAGKFFEI